jgi:hypothetical protein
MLKDQIYKTEFTEVDWLLGCSNAHVTILEYGDFECPYTAMARPVLESLVDEYTDAIQLVFRHFPISPHIDRLPWRRRQPNRQARRACFGRCTTCSSLTRTCLRLKTCASLLG